MNAWLRNLVWSVLTDDLALKRSTLQWWGDGGWILWNQTVFKPKNLLSTHVSFLLFFFFNVNITVAFVGFNDPQVLHGQNSVNLWYLHYNWSGLWSSVFYALKMSLWTSLGCQTVPWHQKKIKSKNRKDSVDFHFKIYTLYWLLFLVEKTEVREYLHYVTIDAPGITFQFL